jgi:flavin reductase (DIM6/NTAB) family NADH-FMN oxidoreductase RutF
LPIDPTTFRDLMRRWASGVTVVTCGVEGRVHGMTASSFSSLSLDPPLALVCVGKGKLTHALLEQQGMFGIHILGSGQRELSDRCAGFLGEEAHWLDDVPHREEATGAPILEGALGWMDCTLWKAVDGGDHTLFIGEIRAAGSREGEPLLWFNRGYHTLADA